MAKKNKQTEEAPKRRGRPSAFPGQETIPFLTHVPAEIRDMVRDYANRKETTMNAALAALVTRAFQASQPRAKKESTPEVAAQ